MRPLLFRSLAAASLLLAASCAWAAARPRYGGTLRIEVRGAPARFHPADDSDSVVQRLAPLVFDTLVRLDDHGAPQPHLARIWQHGDAYQRWQFWLWPGVKLHDGSALTLAQVASSLAAANPQWRTSVLGESVVVECEFPCPHLAAELARPRYSIVVNAESGKLLGTGPYAIADWQPGRRAVLRANETYWRGRPFLDAVQVEMGRSLRDQVLDLDLGRADVVEVSPEQVRRAAQEGRRVVSSLPAELMALVFVRGRQAAEDAGVRQAIALSIDRATIHSVLLQRQGEVAGALLPQWLSGYAFLFPAKPDIARARQLKAESKSSGPLFLAYDSADPVARLVAERISVNARDAGLLVQVFAEGGTRSANADARIARFRLAPAEPAAALAGVTAALDPAELPRVTAANSPEELYAAERGLLEDSRVVPLLHLPEAYALAPRVHGWVEPRAGGWPLTDAWLEPAAPARTEPQP